MKRSDKKKKEKPKISILNPGIRSLKEIASWYENKLCFRTLKKNFPPGLKEELGARRILLEKEVLAIFNHVGVPDNAE